ncbi:Dps family protein [Metabacillus iocasae]|uniref:Starvation-inducible DNA-binding protein n=1 Tax=Priestia iocasae TaxID=2291674 RepID=A0ABS2QWJ6_9BACI|nr:DNA starvation/stationary phase protection protein [Metabacillus iocasae]MBM7703843.1 starvation-inducible DNA-binding protein [Metabacillus iocasae]
MNLEQVLNVQIANWNVLYTKLHHFHWYVKGPQFFTLHNKFEELFGEAAQYVDEYAERLLSIGGKPISTLRDYLEQSTIAEAAEEKTAEEIIQAVIDDYTILIYELKEGIKVAENQHDAVTADMFIETIGTLEKNIWMLKSTLMIA